MELHDPHACARIVLVECKDGYARAYARALLEIPSLDREAMHSQLLYLLCNLGTWRGDKARRVKDSIKHLIRQYQR